MTPRRSRGREREDVRADFPQDHDDRLILGENDVQWDVRTGRPLRDDDRPHARDLRMQDEMDSRSRERDSGYREDNTFGISNFDREQNYRGSQWVPPAGGYRPTSERAQFSGPRRGTGYGQSSGYADAERYGSSRRVIDEPLPHDLYASGSPREHLAYARADERAMTGPAYGRMHEAGGMQLQERGYRGIGPKNYQRSDDRIREDLCDHLCDAWDVDASDIDIKVRNGIATLTGSVRERAMKHRAEDLAERIPGVQDVENQLKVGSGKRMEAAPQSPALRDTPAATPNGGTRSN